MHFSLSQSKLGGQALQRLPLVILGVVSLSFAGLSHAQTLSFKQVVERTLSENPNMQVGQSRIEQAQAALAKAKGSRMPKISLSMTGSVSNNPLNVFGMKLQQRQATFGDFGISEAFNADGQPLLNASGIAPDDLNEPGTHTDLNTRIEVMVPVWNGGKIEAYQDQAQAMIRAAQGGDVATQQHLMFYDYQAFEAVHAARAYIEVAQQALKTADEFVRMTKNLVEQGVVVRSELLSAQVNQSNARVALMKAQEQEQMALDSLKMLMNMEMTAPLDITGRVSFGLKGLTVEQLVAQALAQNPELVALKEQINAENQSVKVAKAAKLPSFNVMLRQDWNDESIGIDASSTTVAGVASWTLSDFGVSDNSIAMAQSVVTQKKAQLNARENEIRMQVYKAWRTLKVAEIQVDSSQLAVEQATKAREMIKFRFENGLATITEVLASQTQLDKANADLVNAQYEVKVQQARLRLLSGMLDIAKL